MLDVVRHPKMFDRDVYGVADGHGQVHRWTIDPARDRVTQELVDERIQELPRIDARRVGQPYRNAYTLLTGRSRDRRSPTFLGVAKHDLQRGRVEEHRFPRGSSPGEPVFVPRGADEDDGWVFVLVHDRARGASDLVVIDAADFRAEPVARVHLPRRVPNGFHGLWVDDPA